MDFIVLYPPASGTVKWFNRWNSNFSATSWTITRSSLTVLHRESIYCLAHGQTSFTFLKDVLRENFDRALFLVALTN